ncbi:TIGR02611 family protein [Pseudonocardia sp. RS11V-5]|uniref:TIGR02611 family protein n=1 Tax=Pseudonocardia terrae TaxID=2905831 RepID=UPI001E5FBC31|nr:TIGR02611 family protein [Pseudonocardia terrae]MCE3555335.1 TIGR02611 family protein [Pseudonocardia terrae]
MCAVRDLDRTGSGRPGLADPGRGERAGGDLSSTEQTSRGGPEHERGRFDGVKDRLRKFRARIDERPTARRTYRVGIGVLGTLVLAGGIVAIPYPGPGWAIVFVGLAILASEFTWAKRVLTFAKGKYDAWTAWLGRQNLFVKLLVLAATGLVVVATLWLLNAFWLVAGWVGLQEWTWLQSPILG